MKEFIDKTSETSGTPINRATMMAIQGYQNKVISFGNNVIIESGEDYREIRFNADGSITDELKGEKRITKTIIFNNNGTIREVIS